MAKKIDYSDIPELTQEYWKNATWHDPVNKRTVTIRLDNDIIEWFKGKNEKYQTKINSVLKSYMTAHQNVKKKN